MHNRLNLDSRKINPQQSFDPKISTLMGSDQLSYLHPATHTQVTNNRYYPQKANKQREFSIYCFLHGSAVFIYVSHNDLAQTKNYY